MGEKSYKDRAANPYAAIYASGEPYMSCEEREQKEREARLARCRTQFHSDFGFDRAVEALEKFDRDRWNRYPIPGETRRYGDQRVYFKVFDNVWKVSRDSVSISLLMEESPRFGVDVTAIVSDMSLSVGDILADSLTDTDNIYFNEIKKLLGVEVPKRSRVLIKKIKAQLGLGEK